MDPTWRARYTRRIGAGLTRVFIPGEPGSHFDLHLAGDRIVGIPPRSPDDWAQDPGEPNIRRFLAYAPRIPGFFDAVPDAVRWWHNYQALLGGAPTWRPIGDGLEAQETPGGGWIVRWGEPLFERWTDPRRRR